MSKYPRTLILAVVGLSLIGSLASARAALPDQAIRAAAGLVEQAGQAAQPADAPTDPAPPAAAPPTELSDATGLPDEALAKLDPDLIYSLAMKKIDNDRLGTQNLEPPLAAVIVPSAMFAMIVLLVWLVAAFRIKRTRQIHETLRLMVEKGADIPTELITPAQKKNVDLRRGLILVFGGTGYMLFMGLLAAFEPDAINGLGVGLIPFFIGIGYLLVWRIEKRQSNET